MMKLIVESTILILPSPEWEDAESIVGTVISKLAMNGIRQTHVKTTNRQLLKYMFNVTRPKSLEMRAFHSAFHSTEIKVIDHHNRVIVGFIKTNPLSLVSSHRSVYIGVSKESVKFDLEIEGTVL